MGWRCKGEHVQLRAGEMRVECTSVSRASREVWSAFELLRAYGHWGRTHEGLVMCAMIEGREGMSWGT